MKKALAVIAAPVVVAALVTVVWLQVVDPWFWTVKSGRLTMDEVNAAGEFRAIAWFVALGVAACLIWGFVVGTRFSHWLVVPLLVASAGTAALIAWRLGVWFGPPDPATVKGLSEGDTVRAQIEVKGVAPYIAWPLGALAGVLGSVFVARGDSDSVGGSHRR